MVGGTRSCWNVRRRPSRARWCGEQTVQGLPSRVAVASVLGKEAGDRVDERRLAGAIRADEPQDRAFLDGHRDIGERFHSTELHVRFSTTSSGRPVPAGIGASCVVVARVDVDVASRRAQLPLGLPSPAEDRRADVLPRLDSWSRPGFPSIAKTMDAPLERHPQLFQDLGDEHEQDAAEQRHVDQVRAHDDGST